jgi:predicted HTH domain antitoxin
MTKITIVIPDDILEALKESPETTGATVGMTAAAKLYETGCLSTGTDARLAGVARSVFLTRLAHYGVDTFELTDEDLDEKTRLA